MSTSAQIAANKVNAKLSTGPRTAEGKARSAQNSLQHGLYSNRFLVRADEEIEFNEFYAAYVEDLQPRGAVEHTLFDELVHAAWNMRRIRRIETEFRQGLRHHIVRYPSHFFDGTVEHIHAAFKRMMIFRCHN